LVLLIFLTLILIYLNYLIYFQLKIYYFTFHNIITIYFLLWFDLYYLMIKKINKQYKKIYFFFHLYMFQKKEKIIIYKYKNITITIKKVELFIILLSHSKNSIKNRFWPSTKTLLLCLYSKGRLLSFISKLNKRKFQNKIYRKYFF